VLVFWGVLVPTNTKLTHVFGWKVLVLVLVCFKLTLTPPSKHAHWCSTLTVLVAWNTRSVTRYQGTIIGYLLAPGKSHVFPFACLWMVFFLVLSELQLLQTMAWAVESPQPQGVMFLNFGVLDCGKRVDRWSVCEPDWFSKMLACQGFVKPKYEQKTCQYFDKIHVRRCQILVRNQSNGQKFGLPNLSLPNFADSSPPDRVSYILDPHTAVARGPPTPYWTICICRATLCHNPASCSWPVTVWC
jgi:hypothetical protein